MIYGYVLWLIGHTKCNVPVGELREVMARWYFKSQITGRAEMGYQDFLVARRTLMAEVTREGFRKVSDPN